MGADGKSLHPQSCGIYASGSTRVLASCSFSRRGSIGRGIFRITVCRLPLSMRGHAVSSEVRGSPGCVFLFMQHVRDLLGRQPAMAERKVNEGPQESHHPSIKQYFYLYSEKARYNTYTIRDVLLGFLNTFVLGFFFGRCGVGSVGYCMQQAKVGYGPEYAEC